MAQLFSVPQNLAMGPTRKLKRYLREWRGDMTLEEAAARVEQIATARGLDLASKKIPTSHAAISRLESGKVDYGEITLELLAEVYGCHPLALISRSPKEPPTIWEVYDTLSQTQKSRLEGFIEGMTKGAA